MDETLKAVILQKWVEDYGVLTWDEAVARHGLDDVQSLVDEGLLESRFDKRLRVSSKGRQFLLEAQYR